MDYRRIPSEIPKVGTFLADRAHRVKSFGAALYKLKSHNTKLKISKTDCERLKKSFGCAIYSGIRDGKSFDDFANQMNAVLQHHFGDHSYCDQGFCNYMGAPKDAAEEELRRKRFRPKGTELYEAIKEVFVRFTTTAMLLQVFHDFSSQKNESLNKEVTVVAPKDKTFSMSKSLEDRVNFVVIRSLSGNLVTIKNLLGHLGCMIPESTREYLRRQDRRRTYNYKYQSSTTFRRKRSEAKSLSIREQLAKEVEDDKLGYSYETGVAVLGKEKTERKKKGVASLAIKGAKVCKCGSLDHSRVSHRSCPLNTRQVSALAVVTSQAANVQSTSDT